MKTHKFTGRFWCALVIFSLVGQVAWVVENMYFNVFIYKMFAASPAAISAMVAASAVAATLTTLFMGALSDKIGKRKLLICGGYILWGISIAAFALIRMDILTRFFGAAAAASAGVSLVIVLDCVMTFFGSTANDAAFNAWLTDATQEGGRGKAEGINAMMPLMAILVVFGGFMGFDLSKANDWSAIFIIIGIAVLLIGIVGLFLLDETATKKQENSHYFQNIFYGLRPSVIKANKSLYFTLIAFAVFGISIQIFMPYLILYYTETLKMTNYVFIMAPAILLAGIMTALYGKVYDKKGFVPSLLPSLSLLCGGYILLFFFQNTALVFIGSLLMMCGYLSGSAVFGAHIRTCTPHGKAGMFQGLRIIGQVLIPGIIGPAIGAAILKNAETVIGDDGTYAFIPNQNIFLGALIAIVVLLPLLYSRKGERS